MRPYGEPLNIEDWARDVTLQRQSDIVDASTNEILLKKGSGHLPQVLEKAASFTLGDINSVVDIDESGGAITVTLNANPNKNSSHTVINTTGTNTVTVDGGVYNINGSATHLLTTQYQFATYRFIPVAGEWRIVAQT